jgi:hypothetical protein
MGVRSLWVEVRPSNPDLTPPRLATPRPPDTEGPCWLVSQHLDHGHSGGRKRGQPPLRLRLADEVVDIEEAKLRHRLREIPAEYIL